MRTYLLTATLCAGLIASGPIEGQAQTDVPTGEFYIGRSEVWVRSSALERQHDAGEASITGNFNRWAGLEFDFKYPLKAPHFITPQKIFLGGPHFAYRRFSFLNPFVHVLLGLAMGKINDPNPVRPQHSIGRWVFTTAAGGGLDIKVKRFLWIRAFQVDYLRESPYTIEEQVFEGGTLQSRSIDVRQNNVTLSFGAVIRWGSVVKGGGR
jgi:hypothetical protein